ncbi:MAG: hypothetical protein ABJD66_01940, partial [Cellulophaga sp.]
VQRDSIISNYKSKFFSSFNTFPKQMTLDSLFMDDFFNEDFFSSDFGEDFMQLDKIRDKMMQQQQQFFNKYSSKNKLKENEKTKL